MCTTTQMNYEKHYATQKVTYESIYMKCQNRHRDRKQITGCQEGRAEGNGE